MPREAKAALSERNATVFYGSCPECGAGYWAEVTGGPHSADTTNVMCGPTLNVVCHAHHPVADVELRSSGMFGAVARRQWDEWRAEVYGA